MSYIKYPKACQKGEFEMMCLFCVCTYASVLVTARGPGVSAVPSDTEESESCPTLSFDLRAGPGLSAKLWLLA